MQNSANLNAIDTREELAKIAGVSTYSAASGYRRIYAIRKREDLKKCHTMLHLMILI